MVIEISRREVLNNLIRFKDNLLERRGKEKAKSAKKERVYKVLLNRKTGDMRFAQKISSLERHFPKKTKGRLEDWKEIRLIVIEGPNQGVHFEARDLQDHELKQSDVEPLSWRISHETLEVLNAKGGEIQSVPPEMLPEEAVLQDLSSIHLAPQGGKIEDLPGWMGSLTRMEAEERLMNQPVGTFLLRDGDQITQSTVFHLSLSNRISSQAYVLTVVEKQSKISEYLCLHTDRGWLFYSDEPDLKRYHFYPTAQELLLVLSPIARHPLTNR